MCLKNVLSQTVVPAQYILIDFILLCLTQSPFTVEDAMCGVHHFLGCAMRFRRQC